MHFTLELVFAGLIALVQSQDGRSLTILLVESQTEFTASNGSRIPPHLPLLAYSCDDRPSGCGNDETMADNLKRLTDTWGRSPHLSKTGVLPLAGVEISLVGDFSVDPGFRMVTHDRQRFDDGTVKYRIVQGNESRDVSWIADMRRIAPNSAKVKPTCVNDAIPPSNLVVARGRFMLGELSAKRLLFGGDVAYAFKPLLVKEFPRTDCSCGQALADRTALTLNVKGCSAEIVLKLFGQNNALHRIALSPPNCKNDPNTKATVYVSNRMKCSKWDLSTSPPTCQDDHAKPDNDEGQHFEIYYKLSENEPASSKRPVPFRVLEPRAGGDGDDRPICPQPRFSGQ